MKRLALTCLCTAVLAAESAFVLPHRWQDARHALTETIRTAPSRIVVVTDRADDAYIRRALRDALERGKRVTLITASESTAAQWAVYKSAEVCILPATEPLAFSLVAADTDACSASLPLSTEALRSRYGIVRCGDSKAFDETIRLLKRECRAYFE